MSKDNYLDTLAMELGEWRKTWEMPDGFAWDGMETITFTQTGDAFMRSDWLDRRDELINCPPDSEAPSWAKWKAQDSDGEWNWFKMKPTMDKDQWGEGEFHPDFLRATKGAIPNGHLWQDTLTEVSTMTKTAHEDQFEAEAPHEVDARQLDEQLERNIATFQSACQEAAQQTEREFGLPNATSILNAAAQHMEDRAATYDKPQGERSMRATVDAFSAITGHHLNEEQGWLFMQLLKAVRSQQGAYRADSYEDGAAYVALAGEAAAKERS